MMISYPMRSCSVASYWSISVIQMCIRDRVKEMAHYNLNKLEIATNKRVVHLEMNMENEITMETK